MEGIVSLLTENGSISKQRPDLITQLLDFTAFAFILAHFNTVSTLIHALIPFGTDVVMILRSSINALKSGRRLPFDNWYRGRFDAATYSMIMLKAVMKRMNEIVQPAKIPISYLIHWEVSDAVEDLLQRPL
jgi:hypothetical protein